MRMLRIAAVVCTLAVAGGCGGAGRVAGAPEVNPRWESCDAIAGQDTDAPALPRLDDNFQPVSAVLCLTAPRQRATGGTDLVATEKRADDVAALVAALRLPDEEPTTGACTMELITVPWLALLDADGRWIRPGVPVDSCRKPRIEVRTALDRLRTTTVSSRVVQEIESDRAAATGCGQTWADMVWVVGQTSGGQHDIPGDLAAANVPVNLCVFRVPASERGGGKPAGRFESGRKLPAGTWVTVRRELTASGPAAPCRTPASRFALLRPPTGLIYVEADGCRRVLINDVALRQGSPKLISLLFP
jgi:hypothetical protein